MIKKSILIWLCIIPLAILNGALREGIINPLIGEIKAGHVSVIILCFLIFIVSFIFIPKLGKGTNKTYLLIGILWVFLTIVFETTLGLLMGISINELIQAYNITTGNSWIVVVIFTGIVPLLIAKIKRLI